MPKKWFGIWFPAEAEESDDIREAIKMCSVKMKESWLKPSGWRGIVWCDKISKIFALIMMFIG